MPERVISNTSPLFYLHRLRRLDLLQRLYQQVLVPEAVVDELNAGRDQGEDVPDVADCAWIEVHPVREPEVVTLITDLGAGEAQVLALALEAPGSLVLLDDRLARAVARMRNIRMTGTAGVLLKAKQEGHITAVAPLLERLLQLDFRLSNAVKASILKLARE
jgi:predicted nucleic acid-binding protein